MQAHIAQHHPSCQFCTTRYFDSDTLYKHMSTAHSSCFVCRQASGSFRYFRTPDDLRAHMNAEHHACRDPVCQQACVGFASAEELRAHHLAEHTNRMPRMDRSRAYRLQVEPPAPVAAPSGASATSHRQLRHQRHHDSPRLAGQRSHAPAATQSGVSQQTAHPQGLMQHRGLVMIDDAEGTVLGGPEHAAAAAPQWPGAPGQQQGDAAPAFPLLSDSVSTNAQQAAPHAARPPPLVRKQLACPCGRNRRSVVVREGTEPGSLVCNAQCASAQRQQKLADAFGRDVNDAATLLPSRDVEWSADLVVVCGLPSLPFVCRASTFCPVVPRSRRLR